MNIKYILYITIWILFAGSFSSCTDDELPEWKNCTIKHVDYNDYGYCYTYVIIIENDRNKIQYKPDHLPDNLKVDNLPVKIKYIITEETYLCGFSGFIPIMKIIEIEKRK